MDVLPLAGFSFVERLRLERAERLGCLPAERGDELAVVGVSDLARPVIEFELLESREGAVALLREADALPLLRREFREAVLRRRRLPPERPGHRSDARH